MALCGGKMIVSFVPSECLPLVFLQVCPRLDRQAAFVLFDLGYDPVEDFGCYLLPCREWFQKVREHEAKAENLDQLRAHGWIAGVARQLVKNQLPDEFATLEPVLSCQAFDVLNLPRTELRG